MNRPERLVVGRVQRAQGLTGELRILFFLPDPDVLSAQRVALIDERRDVEHAVASSKWLDETTAIVKLEGVSDRTQAESFVGATVSVSPDWFSGEVAPLASLIGAEVFEEELGSIGRVTDLFDNGAQVLLSVETPRGEALIPYVEPFIVGVEGSWPKRVRIRTIPGLLPE
ncbi:MAG: 16S rRNA processing protein RimM [Deltaproteobacteria bacterium]|nr:16S rRNA processing protein RimM [Deltaproteobacteria bacterium]